MNDKYKNAHTHIFTMHNAPKDFLQLYMPAFLAKRVDTFTNTEAGAWVIRQVAKLNSGMFKRYATFLEIGKSSDQITVFENLMSRYPNETMQFITLCQNLEYLGVGRSISGFEGQIEEVLSIKKTYPNDILPFFGLDPRWKSNGTEIRKTVESYFETKIEVGGTQVYPFHGLKIYCSTGHYIFDEKLKETFEWAADNGVHVMSHCYYLGGIYNFDKNYITNNLNTNDVYANQRYNSPKFIDEGKWISRKLNLNRRANCRKSCSYFLEPYSYKSILNYFANRPDKLKICFAHYGGVNQIRASLGLEKDSEQKAPYGVAKINWFKQVQDLMAQHPNVYADISYNVAEALEKKNGNNLLYDVFLKEAKQTYGNQILFGTDYFMTEKDSLEQDAVQGFRNYALQNYLSNGNNLWEQMARSNPNQYLKSKYYP
jgi:predicted TIM-barrel fold metal-dependent hydrolase